MRKLNQEEGYTVTDICDAFEVSRNSYYYHKTKAERNDQEDDDQEFSEFNQHVLEKIKEVKRDHPYYGYRRVNVKLDARVNRKLDENAKRGLSVDQRLPEFKGSKRED